MLRSGVPRKLSVTADGTALAPLFLYDLTTDGSAALVEGGDGAVWLADIRDGTAQRVSALADGTPVSMYYHFGDISPDGAWAVMNATSADETSQKVAFKNLADGTWAVQDAPENAWGESVDLARGGVGVYSTLSPLTPSTFDGSVFAFDGPGEFTRLDIQPSGEQAFPASTRGSVDAAGTVVAFQSQANNLGVDGFNGWDVFATDLQPGVETLVSTGAGGAAPDGNSFEPDVAENAPHLIAFASQATNLVAGDGNGQIDVFLRDTAAGTTTLVSVGADGAQGNGDSRNPDISGDGRFVAFLSRATTLTPGEDTDDLDLFVKDLARDQMVRVSDLPDDGTITGFTLSDDGGTLGVTLRQDATDTGESTTEVWTVANPFLQNTVWRMWNPETQHHFYTIDMPERAQADAGDWTLEGPVFQADSPEGGSGAAVWRFYNARTGDHFYTVDEAEKDRVVETLPDYRLEGVAFLADTAPGIPGNSAVYRFWSDERQAHFYTASEEERDYVLDTFGDIYRLEGIAFWTEV